MRTGDDKAKAGRVPRSFRADADLRQRDAARIAGVSVPTLSRIENGGSARLDVIERVSRAVGADLPEYVDAMLVRRSQRQGAALSRSRYWKRSTEAHPVGRKR